MKEFARVFSFDLLSKGVLGLISIGLIRYMPASEYARYTFALALLAFTQQSISGTFNRLYILMPERKSAANSGAPALLSVQLLALCLLTLLGLPFIGNLGLLFFAVVALIFASCLYEYTRTTFQKTLDFTTYSRAELQRVLLVSFLVLLAVIAFGKDISAIVIVCAQTVACLLILWRMTGARLRELITIPRITALDELLRSLVSDGKPSLFAYFFLSGIFTQIDIFMLAALSNDITVASYGSAYRYYGVLALALNSAHALLLPMVRQISSRIELDELLLKHHRLLIAFSASMFVVATAAGWFVPLVDGGKYPEAIPVLRILSVSIVISFAFSPHVNLILRYGQYRFLVTLMACAMVVAVASNYLLIPAYGAVGAAFATLVSAALVNGTIYLRSKALLRTTIK